MYSGTDNPKQKNNQKFLIFHSGMLCMAFGDSDFPSQLRSAQENVQMSLHSLGPHDTAWGAVAQSQAGWQGGGVPPIIWKWKMPIGVSTRRPGENSALWIRVDDVPAYILRKSGHPLLKMGRRSKNKCLQPCLLLPGHGHWQPVRESGPVAGAVGSRSLTNGLRLHPPTSSLEHM